MAGWILPSSLAKPVRLFPHERQDSTIVRRSAAERRLRFFINTSDTPATRRDVEAQDGFAGWIQP